jgi:hypothetical protein
VVIKEGGAYDVVIELGCVRKDSVIDNVFSRFGEYDQEVTGKILPYMQDRFLQ